jgi:hypothetical protein
MVTILTIYSFWIHVSSMFVYTPLNKRLQSIEHCLYFLPLCMCIYVWHGTFVVSFIDGAWRYWTFTRTYTYSYCKIQPTTLSNQTNVIIKMLKKTDNYRDLRRQGFFSFLFFLFFFFSIKYKKNSFRGRDHTDQLHIESEKMANRI